MSAAYLLPFVNAVLASKGIKAIPPEEMGDGTVVTVYQRGKQFYAHVHSPGLAAFQGDVLKKICA